MGPGWVAGAVRGRALAGRRLGPDAQTMLAGTEDLGAALAYLADTSYGPRLRADLDLGDAQHAVGETALWHLRVLAGWLPPRGGEVMRIVAGWFEAQNLLGHALLLGRGTSPPPPYDLGALDTVWGIAGETRSLAALAGVLRTSGWGEPRDDDLESVLHAIRAGWGRRLADGATEQPRWGEALVAIEIAAGLLVEPGRELGWEDRLVPRHPGDIGDLDDLVDALPDRAAWVLDGIDDLRRAEPAWWDRVGRESDAGLAGRTMDRAKVTCAGMALVVDARRVQGLLAAAWRRGGSGAGHADA